MITKEELRIGNYVEVFGIPTKINNISFVSASFEVRSKPVQITKNWLLAFGFREDNGFFKNKINEIELVNILDKYFNMQYSGTKIKIDIKSVHQLQNLYFALTGEELTTN